MAQNAQHPVAKLLAERQQQRSLPGSRKDSAHLALVVEGGARRGVVSAAMICQLEALGCLHAFDSVHGTSVGAITGAYFIAGQSELGTSTFTADLTGPEFFSWRRALRLRPPLSLEYAYEHLTRIAKPLDVDAVLNSKISLHPWAANANSGRAEDLNPVITTGRELRQAFKATSCMPLLAGPAVPLAGESYYDGGIIDSLPYRQAAANGASHILVLHSWPAIWRSEGSALERSLGSAVIRRHCPALLSAYQTRIRRYNRDLQQLQRYSQLTERQQGAERPALLSIFPDSRALIGHLENNSQRLLAAERAGRDAVRQQLGKIGLGAKQAPRAVGPER